MRRLSLGLGLALLLLLMLLLVAGLGWLGIEVTKGRTMQFDLRIREAIHEHASPPLTRAMIGVSIIGSLYVILPATVGFFVLLWRAGLRHQATLFAFAMAGEAPMEHSLKWAFHRARPQPFFEYPLPVSHSFPSGHALTAMIFFGTVAVLLAARVRTGWGRILLAIGATVMIAAIGFSRVYLGVHYPTDVLAGYIAGLIWMVAVAAGNHLNQHRGRANPD